MQNQYVTFYTEDTPYAEIVNGLIKSANDFGIIVKAYAQPNLGSWKLNCLQKPKVIRQAMDDFPNKAIIWLDADALIAQNPYLFDATTATLAYCEVKGEIRAGTVYVNNTVSGRNFVDQWISLVEEDDKSDMESFARAVTASKVKKEVLPDGYCKIFDQGNEQGVIVHYSASRTNKSKVAIQMELPNFGMRIQRLANGNLMIARRHTATERYLDRTYVRVRNKLEWIAFEAGVQTVFDLKDQFKDKTVYLIGKSPSLDSLTSDVIKPDCPVVFVNDSVKKLKDLDIPNPIYVIQQDTGLGNLRVDPRLTVLVSRQSSHFYKDECFIFDPVALNSAPSSLTAECALKFLSKCEAAKVLMVAFDGDIKYASVVGYGAEKGGDPERFLNHRRKLRACGTVPKEWVDLSVPSPDTHQQS